MNIKNLQLLPNGEFPYFHASPRKDAWGNQGVLSHNLPFMLAESDGLPADLDALVCCSDLQGMAQHSGEWRLLGEVLPAFLAAFLVLELNLNPDKTGVILAGDYFATLDSRGGLDDVRPVWRAFRQHFAWVCGVGGNHDDFGKNLDELPAFKKENGIHYLENEEIRLNGLRIGGISGVAGENGKHLRIPEIQFTSMLKKRIDNRPDVMLLHQNPYHSSTPHKGGQFISEILGKAPGQLLICGHAIWDDALIDLHNGAQILNVGERVVIIGKRKVG